SQHNNISYRTIHLQFIPTLPKSTLFPYTTLFRSVPGNDYDTLDGTSMATPHVAGVVGLIRSADPAISVDEARSILAQTDIAGSRSEEHTSELQSRFDLVCRLLLEKKK